MTIYNLGGSNPPSEADVNAAIAAAIDALIAGAPGALDTLNELAAALGDDANFAATVTNSLSGKVSVAAGLVVVEHGADGTVARPAGAAAVYWIGSVEPANGVDHDLWYNTGA